MPLDQHDIMGYDETLLEYTHLAPETMNSKYLEHLPFQESTQ